MKFYLYCLSVFTVVSCTSKSEKGHNAATTASTTTTTAPAATTTAAAATTAAPVATAAAPAATTAAPVATTAAVSADCQRKGTVLAKFEQNNAIVERLQNDKKTLQWLKITPKAGGCIIVDSILTDDQRDEVRLEDWDQDGFKDIVYDSKWNYEVGLFDPKTNNFRRIDGSFCGKQWDYDKAKGLKYHFQEDKMGGTYELYRIKDLKKVVYAQIHAQDGDGESAQIEVIDNKGKAVKSDPAFVKAYNAADSKDKKKKVLEAYWRKNEALFVPK